MNNLTLPLDKIETADLLKLRAIVVGVSGKLPHLARCLIDDINEEVASRETVVRPLHFAVAQSIRYKADAPKDFVHQCSAHGIVLSLEDGGYTMSKTQLNGDADTFLTALYHAFNEWPGCHEITFYPHKD